MNQIHFKKNESQCFFLDYFKKYVDSSGVTSVLICYEPAYKKIIDTFRYNVDTFLDATFCEINKNSLSTIEVNLESNQLVMFFCDHFTRDGYSCGYSENLQPLSGWLSENSKRVLMLNDVQHSFFDVYSTPYEQISSLNTKLIEIAESSEMLYVHNSLGTELEAKLTFAEPWTNIDGSGVGEIIPAEIATYTDDLNGILYFQGSFLSMIPIGLKHGIIKDTIKFIIEKGKVTQFSTTNKELSKDLDRFFEHSTDHFIVQEIGIGTNENIRLSGINAAYEEKHAGLHLGLGGRAPGSFHLDMILEESTIKFDEKVVFDSKEFLI